MKFKKVLSLVLSFLIVFGSVGTVGFAEDAAVSTFDELKSAIDSAKDGDTITLSADIEKSEVARDYDFEPDVALTIDLNGNTLTLNGDNLFSKDVTFKNGTIKTGSKTSTAFIWMYSGADLVLDKITLIADAAKGYSVISGTAGGKITINNSSIIIGDENNGITDKSEATVIADSADVEIVNSNITATNVARGFVNCGISVDADSSITMENNSKTAFRNVSGTVDGTVNITACDYGIENSGEQTLNFGENANVTIASCAESDVFVGENASIVISAGAVVEYETSYISGTVYGDSVATVNGVECADVEEMLSALNAASGEVTVEIYGRLETSGFGLNNSNITKLSFVAKSDDAEICVDGVSYIDVRYTNYPIEYIGLTLSHINAGQNIDGFLPQYFSTYNGGNVTYTECTFPNGVTACGSVAGTTYEFTDCVFNNTTSGLYSLWVYGNSTNVVVNGGEFCGVRGIKMYSEGSDDFSSLSVNEATFSDTITEKHAVVLTKGESVTLTDNIFNNTTGTVQVDDDFASLIDGKTVTIDGTEYIVDSENFTLEESTPAETIVATVNGEPFTDIQEAIVAAAPNGTVEVIKNATVDVWKMFWQGDKTFTEIIYIDMDGLTINGNDHIITVKDIVSATNGNQLFKEAKELNINNLTFKIESADEGGIGLESGTIENVTIEGGVYGVYPGAGEMLIEGCSFATNGTAIYFETARDNLVVTNNTFNLLGDSYAIILRGGADFTDNNVISGKVNLANDASGTVSGNDFGDNRFKVYNGATATIENNEINNLVFNDDSEVKSEFVNNTLSEEAQAVLDAATAPAGPVGVSTYEELVVALETENANVIMMNDITAIATQSSGYGKAGIVLEAGDVLDGNNYKLTIDGANAKWDCAIAMKGGTVKNLTVSGAMRGIFMPGANGDVIIDSCKLEDVIYTFNSDAGSKDYTVMIKNTDLMGWTSFSNAHKSVTFENCDFGEGNGYAYCRPYQPTTFTGCEFNEGFEFDTSKSTADSYEFSDCTYAGAALGEDNGEMFYNGGSVIIDGESVHFVNPADAVAMIGNKPFETLQSAFAAAEGMLGDVVIELLADAELSYGAREAYGKDDTTSITINGNNNTLTLNQTDSDWSSIGMANADGVFKMNNVNVVKTGYGVPGGAWNTHAINFNVNTELTNVDFDNSIKVSGTSVLTNVNIVEDEEYYGIWIPADAESVTINGGSITATNSGRGIKIADQYVEDSAQKVSLTVDGMTFETAKKAAVLVSSKGGADITTTNCDITKVAADSENFAWVDEDWTSSADKVTVDGGSVFVEGTTIINNIDDLKAFRDDVNAGNTYEGKFVKVTSDIDLAGENWTPIGNDTHYFMGTFDGQDHTIKNLVITGNNSNVGLFGFTKIGEIKNLTVENAKVSGYLNVAVVAGTPYTSKYTNIEVTGHVEVNGFSYVGGVGGKNAYANWTDITVNVDDSSYVKATSTTDDNRAYRTYVGGVVGFNGEGGHTFKNITSNIDVIGDVCDIGGIFGIAHYGNNFENITCTGDVTNTIGVHNDGEDAATDVLETGLIAGVWHNEVGTAVTFKNINATGTISTPNLEGVNFVNGGLIGKAYNVSNNTSENSGSLIIDGQEVWLVVPATGSNSPAYTKEVNGYVRVWGEGGGNAKESFVLKLYSEDTLMATTELNNIDGILDGDVYVTWNFYYPESDDEYWTTTWEEGHPNADEQPTKVELYIDGTLVATTDAQMNGADGINPVVWAELGGVAPVQHDEIAVKSLAEYLIDYVPVKIYPGNITLYRLGIYAAADRADYDSYGFEITVDGENPVCIEANKYGSALNVVVGGETKEITAEGLNYDGSENVCIFGQIIAFPSDCDGEKRIKFRPYVVDNGVTKWGYTFTLPDLYTK